jgi:hypothetical protein
MSARINLTNAAFRYNSMRYFRGKSENVRLGSYGDKKTPITQSNYLLVQNNITAENLAKRPSHITGPYAIDWSRQSDSAVNVGLSFINALGAAVPLTRSATHSANLQLVKVHFNRGPLTTLLNRHANGARNWLAGAGNSGRVVGEIWVVMEGTLASEVTTRGSISADASVLGIKIDLSAGTSTTRVSSVVLPSGTTFAYLLYKVKKWNRDKTVIEELEDDQHGPF